MKNSIIALMIVGIVGLTGCSSDNKSEELKNNLQPEDSVQVDSQNKQALEKLEILGEREEDRWYLDRNSIKDVTSMYEGTKTRHVQYVIKTVVTNPKKYDTLYGYFETDCSGKARVNKSVGYLNDKLVSNHSKDNTVNQNYGNWEVISPDSMLSYVESLVCKD